MGQTNATAASISGRKKKSTNPGDRITLLFVIGLLIVMGSFITLLYLLTMMLSGAMNLSNVQHQPGLLDDAYVDITLVSVTGIMGAFLLVADWALSKDPARS